MNLMSKCIVFADMVKNKGFLPSGPSEIHIQRSQIKDIVFSLHRACSDPDPDTKVQFKANAIIANPPAYGEIIHTELFISSLLDTKEAGHANKLEF